MDARAHHREQFFASYAKELSKAKLLSRSEETALAVQALDGDEAARERLVVANLRLSVTIAASYRYDGLPLSDLVAAGNVGLIRAAELYDPRKGARFATYAAYWVHRQVREAFDNGAHAVRLPRYAAEMLQCAIAVGDDLYNVLERKFTLEELAAAAGLNIRMLKCLIDVSPRLRAMCVRGGRERNEALTDPDASGPGGEGQVDYAFEIQEEAEHLLSGLSEKEAYVIRAFYGLSTGEAQSMAQIGRQLGYSRERIRQIRQKALAKMRGRKQT